MRRLGTISDVINDADQQHMTGINSNSVSLAGEFAVLSQLALKGYDANMTLGRTKGVDILVSNPQTGRMLKKHEEMQDPDLFYCFVNISEDTKKFRFFIVPSRIVADYVSKQHKLWLDEDATRSRENTIRTFRIGYANEKYRISTPTEDVYEDNWTFSDKVLVQKSRTKTK
jgi:hypothetical protein